MTNKLRSSQLLIERVQINGLSAFALLLNSLAAIPGFVGSMFLLVTILNELFPGARTLNPNDWLELLPLFGTAIVGWWLYATYLLEFMNSNPHGKVTWLVSALANAGGVIFSSISLDASKTVGLSSLILIWCLVMTLLSARVWVLRSKEHLHET